MKVNLIGSPKEIINNYTSLHNYFAWPTAVRLQDGRIAVGASGFRIGHICPFGKALITFSEDNGESYSPPTVVIDTVMDDRDVGLCTFGESGLILTSFNTTKATQFHYGKGHEQRQRDYYLSYLNFVPDAKANDAISSMFKISNDCGKTFGPLYKSPVTSPHGPIELKNGTILWVGTTFAQGEDHDKAPTCIEAHKINLDGTTEFVGRIEGIYDENGEDLVACEPYAIELDDGTIMCHIRADKHFNTYQSLSKDGGKTWSKPKKILERSEGAPMHLMKHSSGAIIGVYGYRQKPHCQVRAMISKDNGETWDVAHTLFENPIIEWDLGYPSTVEMEDGSLLTVFYSKLDERYPGPAVIYQQRWSFED